MLKIGQTFQSVPELLFISINQDCRVNYECKVFYLDDVALIFNYWINVLSLIDSPFVCVGLQRLSLKHILRL